MTLTSLLLVAVGGGLGAVLRYITSHLGQSMTSGQFPIGTLLVNILGCGAIGIISAYLLHSNPQHRDTLRVLLIVGLLGGFTTYSSFAIDTLNLFQSGKVLSALAYVLLSNVLGIFAAWACFSAGTGVFPSTPS